MFFALSVFVVVIAFGQSLANENTHDRAKVFCVIPKTAKELATLQNLMTNNEKGSSPKMQIDFWQQPTRTNVEVCMMVEAFWIKRLLRIFKASGMSHSVLINNVAEHVEQIMSEDVAAQDLGQDGINTDIFNTLSNINAMLVSFTNSCRTGLTCELYSIGQTYEDRPINVFKISKPGPNRKAYWIDATIHAREWISTATVIKIIELLVKGGDANAIALTDLYDWYFVAVMNPDGYEYTWTTDRLWRKNRNPNENSACIGTDLNRNFDFRWGNDGVSYNPCSYTYCGSSGGSEAETQAVQAELVRLGPTLAAVVTFHAYGNLWMLPYGNTVNFTGKVCERCADHDDLMVVANAAANAIQNTFNTAPWVRGNSCEKIYATTGTTDQYAKGVARVKYAFCSELRGNSFVVSASEIALSFKEVWNGIVTMCNTISA